MSTKNSVSDDALESGAQSQTTKEGTPSDKFIDAYLVTLEPQDDPQKLPLFKRWLAVLVISSASVCVAFASAISADTQLATSQAFHVSNEVSILATSLFVVGLGVGPLFVGPMSEVYGRNIVYWVSYSLYAIFTFPVAFAPNMACFLVFRLITGTCSAAFLSVAGGSVSDMFPDSAVGSPMAVYTMSTFAGPVLSAVIGGFVVQNLYWRWLYWITLIWAFAELALLLLFVPETFVPILLKRKAAKLRKTTGDSSYYAPLDKEDSSLVNAVLMSCYKPFELLILDRMSLLLALWCALLLGILYLALQAYPIIFGGVHHFDMQSTGLTFLGMGVGVLGALATQPLWNRYLEKESAKHNGNPPPEVRLVMGQVGAVLVPISLYWFAFTTYPNVHWIGPVIATVPFGTGIYYVFTSVFGYLVTAYRPIAATAMSSNSTMRSAFAAAFPLFAGAMYDRLGTVGATALLAGLTTLLAPLPFVFYRIGARLRQKSRFAAH